MVSGSLVVERSSFNHWVNFQRGKALRTIKAYWIKCRDTEQRFANLITFELEKAQHQVQRHRPQHAPPLAASSTNHHLLCTTDRWRHMQIRYSQLPWLTSSGQAPEEDESRLFRLRLRPPLPLSMDRRSARSLGGSRHRSDVDRGVSSIDHARELSEPRSTGLGMRRCFSSTADYAIKVFIKCHICYTLFERLSSRTSVSWIMHSFAIDL